MLSTFQKIVVQLNDKIEFSRQTTLSSGYSRRKKVSVSDLEAGGAVAKVIDMHSHRTDTHSVWRCVW